MSGPDVPWLRRLPRRPAAQPQAQGAPQAQHTRRIDLVNRARTGATPAAPTGQGRAGGIDLVHPGRAAAPVTPAPSPSAAAPAAAPAVPPEPTRRIDLVNRARRAPGTPGASGASGAGSASASGIDLVRRGRGEGASTAPPAPTPVPPLTSLTSLTSTGDGPPATPAPPAHRGAALTLRPPPGVAGIVTLDRQDPVVRLDALQSGIGGLTVRGAERVAWEDVDDRSGVVDASGSSTGDDVPQHGNRSLLRPLGGEVVVTLRHVRRLRRLLVDAPADHAVGLAPWCDGVVRAADPDARLRLSVVVVEGRLEVRVEYGLPEPWREALTAMGWSPLASVPRPAPDVWA